MLVFCKKSCLIHTLNLIAVFSISVTLSFIFILRFDYNSRLGMECLFDFDGESKILWVKNKLNAWLLSLKQVSKMKRHLSLKNNVSRNRGKWNFELNLTRELATILLSEVTKIECCVWIPRKSYFKLIGLCCLCDLKSRQSLSGERLYSFSHWSRVFNMANSHNIHVKCV